MRGVLPATLRGLALSGLALALLAGPGPLRAQTPPDSEAAAPEAAPPPDPPPPRPRPRPRPVIAPAPVVETAASDAAPIDSGSAAPAPPPPPAPPPAVGRLQPGEPIPAEELDAFVTGVMRQAMSDEHIAGATVSVVQNGQVILKQGYGVAAQSPARRVDPDRTLFRVGSISKLFTWIAVMREVERGHMRLDAPVNLYLPEPLQVKDQGYQRQVLLKDLMTHSPGFEDRMFGRLFERAPDRVRPLALYLRQEKPRRIRDGGVVPEYSNYGAALAGAAVAQVAGRPFEDLIEAEILNPLSLSRTTFREPYPADPKLPAPMAQALAADVSEGFRWTGSAFDTRPFEYISQIAPAGSASSTASDMARFMTLILAGGTLDGVSIYSPQTAQAFRTVTLRTGPGIGGWASGFLQERQPGGFDGYGHEGQTLSFRSKLLVIPALNLGVFIAVNSDSGAPIVERLSNLIVARYYAPPKAAEPEPAAEPAVLRAIYAGDYLTEKRRYGGLEQFIALLSGVVHIDVTREGRLLVRARDGGGLYATTENAEQVAPLDGSRPAGFQLIDGVAQRWRPPNGTQTYQRIGPLWQARTLGALAAAALIASLATLVGIATRDRREFRQTPVQGGASALQTNTAILWFIAVGGFATWALPASRDDAYAFFFWPGPWIVVASASALVAALCSLIQVALLPGIWRGGRRVDSWTAGRKLRFTATTLIFVAFATLLLMWGALEPWTA